MTNLQGKIEEKLRDRIFDILLDNVDWTLKKKTVWANRIADALLSLIHKEKEEAKEKGYKKAWEKAFTIVFDLTQSHNCTKDTACEFEDRAFKALEQLEAVKKLSKLHEGKGGRT